jgi:penicillin V acylase-like amidase (Ntn superfamily)
MNQIQIIMIEAHGFKATVHVALEDASGDSAILEFAQGKLVVHHGPEFTIMTNDPTYEEQLNDLSKLDFSNPSAETKVPGNVSATDRFQRAAYYSALLPKTADQRGAVAGVMAVMRSVSVPFGAPYPVFGVYNTEYRTVSDLSTDDLRKSVRNDEKTRGGPGTKKFAYFFELTTSPNVIWVEFKDLNFDKDAKAVAVNPYDSKIIGDVASQLTPYSATF